MSAWNSLARLAAAGLWLAASASEVLGKAGEAEATGTTITAEKMTVRNHENKAIFEGSVVLTKGSLVVHSDTMVVSFSKSHDANAPAKAAGQGTRRPAGSMGSSPGERGGGDLPVMGNRSISMIEATGRVRIEKDDGTATCQKAVYYGDEEKIVLTGEPVAWQKGTRVTGQKITLYLAEDRSVVEGGSRVMIEPEEAQRR
ncbi:LptA/OstA family protein [Nitrospira sp. Kam-Ns4a]